MKKQVLDWVLLQQLGATLNPELGKALKEWEKDDILRGLMERVYVRKRKDCEHNGSLHLCGKYFPSSYYDHIRPHFELVKTLIEAIKRNDPDNIFPF